MERGGECYFYAGDRLELERGEEEKLNRWWDEHVTSSLSIVFFNVLL